MRRMFLNGTAMQGQKDHGVIAGARFLGAARTAPRYRFLAVRGEFPGLLPVDDGGGAIEGELYEMDEQLLFERLLPQEPTELELGTIELGTGEVVYAMQLRPERVAPGTPVVDITGVGGWRAHQAHASDVLTPEALDLVAVMARVHDHSRRALLARRAERADAFRAGAHPGLLDATAAVRAGDWQVRAAPADLTDRRCEITGPSERKMMVGALNSGARVFMTDIEDSLSPGWAQHRRCPAQHP